MKPILTCLLIATFSVSMPTFAADPAEPEVRIYNTENKTFYEYLVNGEVVEIKVVPKIGPTYYLVPAGEDDEGFRRQTDSSLRVPKWVIFSW